jgi:hypothetical protein
MSLAGDDAGRKDYGPDWFDIIGKLCVTLIIIVGIVYGFYQLYKYTYSGPEIQYGGPVVVEKIEWEGHFQYVYFKDSNGVERKRSLIGEDDIVIKPGIKLEFVRDGWPLKVNYMRVILEEK